MERLTREEWARILRNEFAMWSVNDWANWCSGYMGYDFWSWRAYFLEEADLSIGEWVSWSLDYYERQ